MSSTKSNSTETGAGEKSQGVSRGAIGMVALTMALLGALVWGLTPSRPHLTPAPLRPIAPGCLKERHDFVPTNLTEVPNLPLDGLGEGSKNRALLRLNMEPCSCGCGQSLAACRASYPSCESSKAPAENIVAEEKRSEEHTSELQSPYDLVCRLLLEKKKKKKIKT